MVTKQTHSPASFSRSLRRGMVLIIVLVVIVLLSLGAYTFSEYMVIATRATAINGKQIQARALADSGVEYVSVVLADRASLNSVGLYHNPGLFQGHLMLNDQHAASRGRFTVIASVEGDSSARHVRFGLIDESSKLNLNTVAAMTPAPDPTKPPPDPTATDQTPALANPLMGIPGMTLEISEAIFDWIDEDTDLREHGAENEYYQTLTPPYECKNGKLETLDELLLIRDITPQVLFGEDANRNGLLDPNENDGPLTAPFDNADGFLDRGWSAYLTVYSRELNMQPDRSLKIDVNKNTLSDIYDQLEEALGADEAKFLVAYRLFGPVADAAPSSTGATSTAGLGAGAGGKIAAGVGGGGNGTSSGSSRSGSSGGGSGGSGGSSGGSSSTAGLGAVAQAAGQVAAGGSGQVTRGGMDLTNGGKIKIKSVYDLVGVQVTGKIDGGNKTLDSPWVDDPNQMATYLPQLLDLLSTNGSDQFIDGRINVNQAHKEVLLGLPGMTEDIAIKIVSAQARGANGEPLPDTDGKRSNTLWLYAESIVDLPTLRKLNPYLTGRGDVFRLQVMGHFDGGGPVARVEAVIDATQNPPQAIFFRDLTDLGRGYTLPVVSR